ncbi:MAG TPA: hypothetical protein VHJ18_25280 [Streptosporangiaceae bacterium]|nr:hypothetical protein [Streptosporangiaceae bacterium]
MAASNEADDPIVEHPDQPADYRHTDVWTWHQRWRVVGGVSLRLYDRVTLRGRVGGFHGVSFP